MMARMHQHHEAALQSREHNIQQSYQEEHTAAAHVIQKRWRAALLTGKGDDLFHNLVNFAIKEHKRKRKLQGRLFDIIIYFIFLYVFTMAQSWEAQDQNIFYFTDGVSKKLVNMEYEALNTIDQYYDWLETDFLNELYLSEGWNNATGNGGFLLGHGKIIGGIRIGQNRVKQQMCQHKVPDNFVGFDFNCYGDSQGDFEEDYAAFGPAGIFEWSGLEGGKYLSRSANVERDTSFSGETFSDGETARSPAYSITLPNPASRSTNSSGSNSSLGTGNMTAHEKAVSIVKHLRASGYVDQQTRALFIDVNVYNVMLSRLVVLRISARLPKAGGIITSSRIFSADSQWSIFATNPSRFVNARGQFVCNIVVVAFYLYFAIESLWKIHNLGLQYFRTTRNLVVDINIFFFMAHWLMKGLSADLLPDQQVDVEGDVYVIYRPYAALQTYARYVNALNAFLCWFKIVFYLSVIPQLALINGTMARAWKGVRSFCVIFVVVMYGFTNAFQMTFGSSLPGFRNMAQTAKTLLKALLGDFDLDEMVNQHWLMGPLLFICFVAVGVFVVLNMLIAIISDAYAHTENELSKMEEVEFGKELFEYVDQRLRKMPLIGRCYTATHRTIETTAKRGSIVMAQALISKRTKSTRTKSMAKQMVRAVMKHGKVVPIRRVSSKVSMVAITGPSSPRDRNHSPNNSRRGSGNVSATEAAEVTMTEAA